MCQILMFSIIDMYSAEGDMSESILPPKQELLMVTAFASEKCEGLKNTGAMLHMCLQSCMFQHGLLLS